MKANPPSAADAPLVEKLAELGLAYGTTIVTYSPSVAAGIVMGVTVEGSPDLITSSTQVEVRRIPPVRRRTVVGTSPPASLAGVARWPPGPCCRPGPRCS